MDKNTVIEVENVSKKFCKSLSGALKYGFLDITRNIFDLSNSSGLRKDEFWALNNLSFKIKKGESLGIIGANGCGKSTLLKMLSGIFFPDKGRIKIMGRVGALIEIGAGFHQMLTGKENIYVNGVILGMKKKEIDEKFNSIVDFAGIRKFLDTPVKNYSSGMYVRLGFSVAIHSDPDILLVDEVLSVGDAEFQKKSLKKMHEIVDSGKTVIFVSHNAKAVLSFTQKAIYLKNGWIKKIGKTSEVIKEYAALEGKTKK